MGDSFLQKDELSIDIEMVVMTNSFYRGDINKNDSRN